MGRLTLILACICMYKTVQVWSVENCNSPTIDLTKVDPEYADFMRTLSQILEVYQQQNKDLKQVVEDQKKFIENLTRVIRECNLKMNQTFVQNPEKFQDLNNTLRAKFSRLKSKFIKNNEKLQDLNNSMRINFSSIKSEIMKNNEAFQDLNDTVRITLSEFKSGIERNNETLRGLIKDTRNDLKMNLDIVNNSHSAMNIKLREEFEIALEDIRNETRREVAELNNSQIEVISEMIRRLYLLYFNVPRNFTTNK